MVVRTELCAYTEYKIYPGRGMKFIAKDGRMSLFLNAKADSLFHQKIKAVKLTWTQAWRRMNKKGKVETGARRKNKKTTKFAKAVAGMSLEDMKAKRAQRTQLRKDAADATAKEVKDRMAKRGNKKASNAGAKAAKTGNVGKPQKNQGGAGKQKNFNTRK